MKDIFDGNDHETNFVIHVLYVIIVIGIIGLFSRFIIAMASIISETVRKVRWNNTVKRVVKLLYKRDIKEEKLTEKEEKKLFESANSLDSNLACLIKEGKKAKIYEYQITKQKCIMLEGYSFPTFDALKIVI